MQPDSGDRRASSSQRLPVNPRRHKVAPEQRKRVATACNSCNVRRVKCSGGTPCTQCASSNRECVYPVPVEKVQIPRNELDELRRKVETYEKALQEAIPDPARRQELVGHASISREGSTPSSSPFTSSQPFSSDSSRLHGSPLMKQEPEDEQTSGRLLQDPTGMARFLGETSGATFLDQLKELLGAVLPLVQLDSPVSQDQLGKTLYLGLGRYYTDDSLPMVEPDTKPISLPTGEALTNMLGDLRHLIQDGNGEWRSGGIFWWGDLHIVPARLVTPPLNAPESEMLQHRQLAFYYASTALITAVNPPEGSSPSSSRPIHESYFARASALIGNPLDVSRCCTLGDVATLCLMAFYLIELNKRDAAYMHVAAAMHICIMLGVHRGLVDEKGKRVFWTAYILDRWLSCLMGRPHIIMDDAIRLQLPANAPDMPPASGLRAHVELSRISGYVVCNTYRVAPWESARGEAFKQPDKAIWMMQQWHSTLPPDLQLSPDGLSNDPACCLLHMRYNMLLILAIRPLFLAAVKKSIARRLMVHQQADANPPSEHLKVCVAAARRNIRLGRHIMTLDMSRQAPLHAEKHFIFNATVCLILEDLLSEEEVHPDEVEARNSDIMIGLEIENQSQVDSALSPADTLYHLWMLARKLTTRQNMDLDSAAMVPQSVVPGAPSMLTPRPDYQVPHMQIGEDHALYDELIAWVDDDSTVPGMDVDMMGGFPR